jgi:hypothetical protein
MRHQENIKNAQHSKVGRVNLGARITPNTSRKCQENELYYWLHTIPQVLTENRLELREPAGVCNVSY